MRSWATSSLHPELDTEDDCLEGRGDEDPLRLRAFFFLGTSPFLAFSTAFRNASALLSSLNLAPYLSIWINALASFFSFVSGFTLLTKTPPGNAFEKMVHFSSLSR